MPNNTLYAFILSFLAGISTVIGSFIIFIDKRRSDRVISHSLAFAAGVMIYISITDLLPGSFKMILDTNRYFPKLILSLIFMVTGIIISMLIDKYLPDNHDNDNNNSKLYKVGIINMVAIILHNIPEGIVTFITSNNNLKLGILLSISIALHNIPEGIAISVPIFHSTNNKIKSISYSLISGLSEIFGSILSFLFLAPIINNYIIAALYALIAGIMLHISFYELIPASFKKGNVLSVIISFILGNIVMLLSHLFIG